ncbi:MAG: hypothetical protein U0Q18_17330 [Bryobacteraceae bacterium]
MASNPPQLPATGIPSSGRVASDSAQHRHTSANRRDDVANPVHEIQERAFRLRPSLALHCDATGGPGS